MTYYSSTGIYLSYDDNYITLLPFAPWESNQFLQILNWLLIALLKYLVIETQ